MKAGMRDKPVNFIAGKEIPSSNNESYERRNPADERECVGQHALSGRRDVALAIDAAVDAGSAWRGVPGPVRAATLHRAASLLEAEAKEAAREITLEEGKTLTEALVEVQRSVNSLRYFAEQARGPNGELADSEEARTYIFTRKRPRGMVALITPWNFPLSIPTWKSAAALAFGNTVVLKPASLTPSPALRLAGLLTRAQLPAGVFNVVVGDGGAIGQDLTSDERVKAVSFTGSTEVGQALRASLCTRGVPLQAEMGGHSPVIIAKDIDAAGAARSVAEGAFLSAGQKCTATRRVIVEHDAYDAFLEQFVAHTRALRVGNGLTTDTQISPLVESRRRDEVLSAIETARDEGATVVTGGRASGGELRHGAFLEPTILTEVTPAMTIAQDEVFGPVCAVFRASSLEEAVEIANGVRYGLSAALFTRDIDRAFSFMDSIESGMVHINRPTVGAETHMSFGGFKASGSGMRELGRAAREFFTEEQTVYFRRPGD